MWVLGNNLDCVHLHSNGVKHIVTGECVCVDKIRVHFDTAVCGNNRVCVDGLVTKGRWGKVHCSVSDNASFRHVMCVCVFVNPCVGERERERKRERKK